ncbi:dinucleotide-utilizing enzymes [Gluconobacter frateurii NBRC 103465]|nr:dinucleotide-utilizing enzymes [Gluconobacter frateurii NBRC 103465]
MTFDFSDDELERYSRHILLPQVGAIGQARLKNASVLVIGAGGLGGTFIPTACSFGNWPDWTDGS